MLDLERDEQILAILSEKNACTVYELSEKLFVSQSTIRRDLSRMEQKGLVTRTFGGAMLKSTPSVGDTSFYLREKESIQEKRALAKEATRFLRSNTAVFIDSSTTALQIAGLLNDFKDLLIITNGLAIAHELVSKTKHRVKLLGGDIQPSTNSILGIQSEHMLETFHASLAIMSASSIDPVFGLSELREDQADLKRIMIKNADKTVVLVDNNKVGKKSLARTCAIKDVDVIISVDPLSEAYKEAAPNTTFLSLGE